MNFAEAARNNARMTITENGALAYNTSGNALVDLFATIGALRNADEERVLRLFGDAYKEDPLTATKIAFYARDCRGGLGERKVFYSILKYLAKYHKEALIPNLDLVGVYGRFDDLYALVGTPVEDEMWKAMKKQFDEDVTNLIAGYSVSNLAKWIKSADSKHPNTRALGIMTAHKLGYSVYTFKRIVKKLRKKIGIVESLMSQNLWDQIVYSSVPSRAMKIYSEAFQRHDGNRFDAFLDKAVEGKAKINSSTLYPYDLIEKISNYWGDVREDKAVEAQWRQLPNYVDGNCNAMVIADTSGSMMGRPMNTSVGLAIYFAERNTGAYHNMFMSFSRKSTIHVLKGETLAQKINSIDKSDWENNTNLEEAFRKILQIAVENNVPKSEMIKALIIVTDMEIDRTEHSGWLFYDQMRAEYAAAGYEIPNIIFWNVNSRHDTFHTDSTRRGVQLVSGQSIATFKNVMSCVGMTPTEAMYHTINAERYAPITIGV